MDECPEPFISFDAGGYLYCNSSCIGGEYMLDNGTCVDTCAEPFRNVTNPGTVPSCFPPCANPSHFISEVTGNCIDECYTGAIVINETNNGTHYQYNFCSKPNDSSNIVLVKLLHHLKYLNESLPAYALPAKLRNIFVSRGNNIMALRVHSQMLDEPRNDFNRLLQGTTGKVVGALGFNRLSYYSRFIGNFIDDLVLLGIILICEITLAIIEFLATKLSWKTAKDVTSKLRVITRWNLPLSLLCINIGDIIFFANREFRTYDPDTPRSTISLITCIVMLVIVAILYIGTILIIKGINKAQERSVQAKSNGELISYLMKWKNFQVLFGGCTISYPVLRPFYIIYATRLAFPMIFAAFLESVPLLQVVLYCVISISMIIYVLYRKPIQNKIDYINIWVLEGLIFAANACALALVGMYYAGNHNESAKDALGEIIIICSYIIDYIAIIFFITKVVSTVRLAVMYRKEQSKEEKGVWLQLIFLPFQQGGMGFEQVRVLVAAENNSMKIHPSSKRGDGWAKPGFSSASSSRVFPSSANKLNLDNSSSPMAIDNTTNGGSPTPLKDRIAKFNFTKSSIADLNINEVSPDTSKASPRFGNDILDLDQSSNLLGHSNRKLLESIRKDELPSPRVIHLKPAASLDVLDPVQESKGLLSPNNLEGSEESSNNDKLSRETKIATPEAEDLSPLERAKLRRGLRPKKTVTEHESVFALSNSNSDSSNKVKTNSWINKSEKEISEKNDDS